MDNFDLKKYLVENKVTTNSRMLREAVEVPAWLKGKLEDVHVKPGQGSIFAKSVDEILKLAQNLLDKTNPKELDRVANSTGTLTMNVGGAGYNLVLPIDQAKKLPGAQASEVEKQEGPNKVKVPAITTTAPLTQFSTNELTVIVRPKKDEAGTVIPNEYIVLSVFPGDPDIPRASEWNGKYAVIIPGKTQAVTEGAEDDLADIFYEYLSDVRQFTGVTSFETCDEDDWDKVKNYIEKDKKNFLNQHPKIQETNFDEYVENWIDGIEDQRGFESMNQQDLNYGY